MFEINFDPISQKEQKWAIINTSHWSQEYHSSTLFIQTIMVQQSLQYQLICIIIQFMVTNKYEREPGKSRLQSDEDISSNQQQGITCLKQDSEQEIRHMGYGNSTKQISYREQKISYIIIGALLMLFVIISNFSYFYSPSSVSVILNCVSQKADVSITLSSFFHFNTFQVQKIVVLAPLQVSKSLNKTYNNIEWINIQSKTYFDIQNIRKAMNQIESQMVVYIQDNWVFTKKSFIEDNIKALKHDKKAIMIKLARQPIQSQLKKGFTFQPNILKRQMLLSFLQNKQAGSTKKQIQQQLSSRLRKSQHEYITANDDYTRSLYQIKTQIDRKNDQLRQKVTEPESILKPQKVYDQILVNYQKQLKQYEIKIDFKQYSNVSVNGIPLYLYGIDKNIQIGSNFDYLNITKTKQFKSLSKWEQLLSYQIFNFTYQGKLELENISKIKLSHFRDYNHVQNFLKQKIELQHNPTNTYQHLAELLLRYPNDAILSEAQYLVYDTYFNISKSKREIPMCIFAFGYNVASKLKYEQFFQSIEHQNYSNYRLVIVDDSSTDNSASYFYNYLNRTNFRLKNKLTIVYNVMRLGSGGNLYTRIKQFCKQGEIVVNINQDSKIIGTQALQVINSIYQNPNILVACSQYLEKNPEYQSYFFQPIPSYQTYKSLEYRTKFNYFATSHVKTFRRDLHNKIPIQYFMQYHYNQQSGALQPRFYDGVSDRFLMNPLVELSGYWRYFYIQVGLYFKYDKNVELSQVDCYKEHVIVEEMKARIKKPLKTLQSINDVTVVPIQGYFCPNNIIELMQKYFTEEEVCKNKQLNSKKFAYISGTGFSQSNYAEVLSKQLYQYMTQNLQCKQIKVILQKQGDHKMIRPSTLIGWINRYAGYPEENQLRSKSFKKCAVISEFQFEPKLIRYTGFQYLLIRANKPKQLLKMLYTTPQYTDNKADFQCSQENILNKSYVRIRFIKDKGMFAISDKGMWLGKAENGIKTAHVYVPNLNSKLIEFYKRQKAQSIVDLGCGLCDYAKNLKEAGLNAKGFDGNPFTSQLTNGFASTIDLSEEIDLGQQFDFVQTFEVGEHIPVPKTQNFIKNVAKHAKRGIVMSWAVKGQGGYAHINTRSNSQIIRFISKFGFYFDEVLTKQFRSMDNMLWFQNSFMVFRKIMNQK